MGKIRLPAMPVFHRDRLKQHLLLPNSVAPDIRKGHFVVYVGNEDHTDKERFVVPIAYLKHPLFQELLSQAEEEYGFDHHYGGGLTIPCSVNRFIDLISLVKGVS